MIRKELLLRVIIGLLVIAAPISSARAHPIDPTPPPAAVKSIVERMSLEEKIGQLFIIAPDEDIDPLIQTYHPGGFILFSRHTRTLPQTMRLIEHLKQSTDVLPPFIAVDQEGGRVSRLPFATTIPEARNLADLPETALQNIGRLVGGELRALGFNLNFAPVLDVDTCADNPVIGSRSFSADPYAVARLGSAYIKGIRSTGIASTAKHFPGHGDSSADSHLVLPVITQPEERIQAVELLPFRAAIRANVDAIMMAHVVYPSLEKSSNLPSSLSYSIITELLRNQLDYNGIIITDALNMKAITNNYDAGRAAVTAFQAGADIILMPDDLAAAYSALLSSVKNKNISVERINDSVHRIISLKLRLAEHTPLSYDDRLNNATTIVGSTENRRWLDRILKGTGPD